MQNVENEAIVSTGVRKGLEAERLWRLSLLFNNPVFPYKSEKGSKPKGFGDYEFRGAIIANNAGVRKGLEAERLWRLNRLLQCLDLGKAGSEKGSKPKGFGDSENDASYAFNGFPSEKGSKPKGFGDFTLFDMYVFGKLF